ncbi:MAG TPA: DUF5818 domain-containing protein [Terriglobales bacterium]|nr:DUF5818 domain-containing protein [Terriglobales bacterium]
MRKLISSLWSPAMLALLAGMLSLGTKLNAQQTTPAAPQEQRTQPQPAQPPDQSSQPDPQAQSQPSSDAQTFSGTIVKSGGKYMLQDSASGNTYDIDRQDLAKPHEGQKVRIAGSLDSNGKLIHVK